jgi:2-dehydro-3-deoxygluconokinase
MANGKTIVCFGELLLRLNAPGREKLMQSRTFDVHVGGAEANVAVSLAQLGCDARIASVVADNALGDGALGELRRYGVGISTCVRRKGRMGIYFMSAGAVRRPSEILYDRAGSAFAEAPPDLLDWTEILSGAEWLHISGITPAVSPKAAEAAIRAVNAARNADVKISFDGNYRAQLWSEWGGDGPDILKKILSSADLAFINERDVGLILRKTYGDELSARKKAYADAFAAFPKLTVIAATTRQQESVDHHRLSATIATREGEWKSRDCDLPGVVDRIGAGDAFAAGVLYTLANKRTLQYAVDFAAAAAAIKHSVPGDFNLASAAEIAQAMGDGGLDVRR